MSFSNYVLTSIILNLNKKKLNFPTQKKLGQTLDVCGGLSLYNNYMNQYQNMGTWYQEMIDEK